MIRTTLLLFMMFSGLVSLCQTGKPLMIFNPKESEGLILNPAMDIQSFSYQDYQKFIPKLHESDQYYRRKLKAMKGKENSEEYEQLLHLMHKNDRANEVILLNLVKKFGWPCSKDNLASEQAWYTVWHADHFYKTDFYPYLKAGLKKGCVLKVQYDQLDIR